jgi:hypothetical protein
MYTARDGTHHYSISAAHLHDQMNQQYQPYQPYSQSGGGSFIGKVVGLGILFFLIWTFANSDQQRGGASPSQSLASANKWWCMGLVSQIEAREAMANPDASRQIPQIRQQFVEHNCQSYGLRAP